MAKVGAYPDYSSTKGSKFIPEIWTSKVLIPLYDRILAHNPKLNTDYEGEIRKMGDMVLFHPLRVFATQYLSRKVESVMAEMLTIDKGVYLTCYVRDAGKVQADMNLLGRYCKEMANKAFEEIVIPKGPALFAIQVLNAEAVRLPNTFEDKLRMLVGYGFKLLDPFRVATEIIRKAAAQGKNIKEIIVELDRGGF
jgi:hypothetical protein